MVIQDIGVDSHRYDMAHEGFSYGERNNGGVFVLDFTVTYELMVVRSFLRRMKTT